MERKKPGFIRQFIYLFGPSIVVGVLFLVVFKYVIIQGYVPSDSMKPLLQINTFIWGNRLEKNYSHGDVMIFYNEESDSLVVKRIIGVEGDTIEIRDSKVFRNGAQLIEPYIYGAKTDSLQNNNTETYKVPPNSYFVLGDNREFSADSRVFKNTYVKKEDVIAKAVITFSFNDENGYYLKTLDWVDEQAKSTGSTNQVSKP